MGIYQLHSFIQKRCSNGIQLMTFDKLSNKTIVVDTSIYMYKFASQGNLIEGMYKMISILLEYNIVPIFIFDGKPTDNKLELLNERHKKKRESKYEYYKLREHLIENGATDDELRKNQSLNKYKRESTRINSNMVDEVKKLITLFGIRYYQSEHEADSICAYLEKNTEYNIWGCLSEDTDMFVYGCEHILRYISFINHTVIVYDQKIILESLNMTHKNFVDMCICVGSDYNIENRLSINKVYNLFIEYTTYKKKLNTKKGSTSKTSKKKKTTNQKKRHKKLTFMKWMIKNYYVKIKYEDYLNIANLYNLNNVQNICFNEIISKDSKKLKEFLKKYNFIFI